MGGTAVNRLRMLPILSFGDPVDRHQSDTAIVPSKKLANFRGYRQEYRRPSKIEGAGNRPASDTAVRTRTDVEPCAPPSRLSAIWLEDFQPGRQINGAWLLNRTIGKISCHENFRRGVGIPKSEESGTFRVRTSGFARSPWHG